MSDYQPQGVCTLTAGEALEADRYVKLNSSQQVVYADAGDDAQYVTCSKVASGEVVACRSLNAGGSVLVTCETAITTIGSTAYIRNDGKVSQSNADSAVSKGIFKQTSAIGGKVEVEIANI